MIRNAEKSDMNKILEIYEIARGFMAQNGNPTQWGSTYPEKEIIEGDIEARRLFVLEEDGDLCGVFVLMPGPDPTYINIYDGEWQNDEPYFALHRIASSGAKKGFLRTVFEYSLGVSRHLCVDTHRDNTVMQGALEKCGFSRRGIIYLENREERIAYEFIG